MKPIADQDRYRVFSALGAGLEGSVGLAEKVATGKQVALKYFSPRPGVPALAHTIQLVHPHIVGLLNFTYLPGGDCYLIFEYVAGGTLREGINENPISETADALAITRDLLSAPAQIHRDGSAHCDIKPKKSCDQLIPMTVG